MKKKIKILGHKYKIIKDPDWDKQQGAIGSCSTNVKKIYIDSTFVRSRRDETFLHEIFEALSYHLQLHLEHDKLSALSEGLYQVLHDNKIRF